MTRPLAGLLGEGATFEGDVSFDGPVRVDGRWSGELTSDDLVEVGAGGTVDGTVRAPQILVAGTVDGLLEAVERVTLLETAVVSGRIVTPWLDVRVGARLSAQVLVHRMEPA